MRPFMYWLGVDLETARPGYALTKTQKMLLQSFGLNADDTVSRAMEIARKLAESKNEIVNEQGEEDDAQTEVDELY